MCHTCRFSVWEEHKKFFEGGTYIRGDQPFQCPRCGTRTAAREDGREYCPSDGLSFTLTEDGEDEALTECPECGERQCEHLGNKENDNEQH